MVVIFDSLIFEFQGSVCIPEVVGLLPHQREMTTRLSV